MAALLLALNATMCGKVMPAPDYFSDKLACSDTVVIPGSSGMTLGQLARVFAALPLEDQHIEEVYRATQSSTSNGYDEEYTLKQLITAPGCGVGDPATKATDGPRPLRDLLEEYFSKQASSKAGAVDPAQLMAALSDSDVQLYWPFSEDWDGESYPIITFDPGYGSQYNYGYMVEKTAEGLHVLDSVYVDENVARNHPVWVVNRNNDAAWTPADFFVKSQDGQAPSAMSRMLLLKSITMLRNYDSWFQGGSEFFIKCGSVNGFSASTEAELKLYSPSVTDFMVVVPRKFLGEKVELNALIMTNFTNQLDNLAFLVTEDDGGTHTSWKCSATVKIKSKSYGFDIDIPYNEKDDIVWRGQLSANFFQAEDIVSGRFGDVILEFALE